MFDFVHILQEHGNGFQLVKRLFCVVSFNVAIGYSADHSLRFTWIILLVRGLFPFLEAPTRSPRISRSSSAANQPQRQPRIFLPAHLDGERGEGGGNRTTRKEAKREKDKGPQENVGAWPFPKTGRRA